MRILRKVICCLLIISVTFSYTDVTTSSAAAKYYKMTVHYIDVGESDCVLIQSEGKSMLIDAGENDDAELVTGYLKDLKIKKLDYVIATHPHADHIGSMDAVIEEFEIGKIIMPDVEHTTKTFEEVLDAIEEKELKITRPIPGKKYTLGKASFTILSPNSDEYDNLNDYSIAIKVANGKTSFLFIGDCEEEAIEEILGSKADIRATVYMAGHHGSRTSTTNSLLNAAKPKYAVISVGKDNTYGHPSEETLQLLKDHNVITYRTDENGTIVAASTGKTVSIKAEPTDLSGMVDGTVQSNEDAVVYITKTGTKYHRESCSSLSASKIKTTVKDAKDNGYLPCKICDPPE